MGGFTTLLAVAGALPQIFVARLIDRIPTKSGAAVGDLHEGCQLGDTGRLSMRWARNTYGAVWAMVVCWRFSTLRRAGGVPYADISAKCFSPPSARLLRHAEVLSGPWRSAQRCSCAPHGWVAYPDTTRCSLRAAAGLGIASLGIWGIHEPRRVGEPRAPHPWPIYRQQLRRVARRLRGLVLVQLLTGLSLLALPFYITYARTALHAPDAATGWYLLAQVGGGVFANLLWAWLIARYGCKTMLQACATLSVLNPCGDGLGVRAG